MLHSFIHSFISTRIFSTYRNDFVLPLLRQRMAIGNVFPIRYLGSNALPRQDVFTNTQSLVVHYQIGNRSMDHTSNDPFDRIKSQFKLLVDFPNALADIGDLWAFHHEFFGPYQALPIIK